MSLARVLNALASTLLSATRSGPDVPRVPAPRGRCAPLPPNEAERLHALRSLEILDSEPEPAFDALVGAAADLCRMPMGLLSFVDAERQWFKASRGYPGPGQTARDVSMCAYAILADEIFEVPNINRDPRFNDPPMLAHLAGIRFYAGAPLRLEDGSRVGTLCVMDRRPHRLTSAERDALESLARIAVETLERRREAHQQRRLAEASSIGEERLARLYRSTPAMLATIDAAGAVHDISDRCLGSLQVERDTIVGTAIDRFFTAESAARIRSNLLPVIAAGGTVEDFTAQMVRTDGQILDVEVAAVPACDPAELGPRFVFAIDDVTQRKRAEAQLREERRQLAAIIDATGVATWQRNVQTGAYAVNERWAEHLGYTLAELEPLTPERLLALTHPDDARRAADILEEHYAGRIDRYESELRLRHRDGSWIWVLSRGRVWSRTDDGRPEWMFGTHLDITQRKAREQALRTSEAFLERTGRLARVGGWEHDLVTDTMVWSNQTRRIYGVPGDYQPTLDEAIGAYAPESQPVIRAAVMRAMETGEGFDVELPFIRAGGERIWVQVVGSAELDAQRRPRKLVGAIADVTQNVAEREALQVTSERMKLATDSGGIGIWEHDLRSDELLWDDWTYRLHGVDRSQRIAVADDWRRLVHPDDREMVERAIGEALRGDGPLDVEFRILAANGGIRRLRSAARVTRDTQGEPIRLVGASWDITELRELSANLAEQHELLRVTLQSIGDAVLTTDAAGSIVWLNPVAERITGWTTSEAHGQPASRVLHIVEESTREPAISPVDRCLERGEVVAMANHTILIARDGSEFGIEDTAAPIRNDAGEVLGVVLVFHDVTEKRRLSGELRYRASHDALTGLVNRSEFEVRLRRMLQNARDGGSAHALLYIDLDQFKIVNDTGGHALGDHLLVQVAKFLAQSVRSRDTLARLGGDEFAIILDHCPIERAQAIARQICDRMDNLRYTRDGGRFRIGASIGLVPIDGRWTSAEAVFQAADTACYAAKEAGRNRVHVWFDSDQSIQARSDDMQWTRRIEAALDEQRFALFAQRIAVLNGAPPGIRAEVLLRMIDADGSFILPGTFLPAAERFQLASRIDRWVLARAIEWMRDLPSPASVANLSINLSGQSVGDRNFHDWAIARLVDAGPEICSRISLEVTETAAVTNLADAAIFIAKVREARVRVALDDFGAGASSFGYLRTMPVDYLKIDGQFISSLVDDPLSEVTVRCFADVAKVMQIQTVAEFVSGRAILDRVERLHIDFAQGFLIHEPAPIDELLGPAQHVGAPA